MNGKQVRWNRFVRGQSRTALIVPIDHGLTMGPIDGLDSLAAVRRWARHTAITGVIVHRGMADRLPQAGLVPHTGGLMIHLNGMTSIGPQPDTKELLTSVDVAIRHGADAVSLQ